VLGECGGEWRRLREGSEPCLAGIEVNESVLAATKKVVRQLAEEDDVQYETLTEWSLEAVGASLFGRSLAYFNDQNEGYKEDFLVFRRHVHDMVLGPMTWRLFPHLVAWFETFDKASLRLLALARKASEQAPTGSPAGKMLKALGPTKAAAICLDCLLFGPRKVAASVAFLMFNLAHNEKEQEKLRASFKEHNFVLLEACLRESDRMLPVLLGSLRTTPTRVVLAGYDVPEGTRVLAMSRHFSQYGEDSFRPERKDRIEYDPFGNGKKLILHHYFIPTWVSFRSQILLGEKDCLVPNGHLLLPAVVGRVQIRAFIVR